MLKVDISKEKFVELYRLFEQHHLSDEYPTFGNWLLERYRASFSGSDRIRPIGKEFTLVFENPDDMIHFKLAHL